MKTNIRGFRGFSFQGREVRRGIWTEVRDTFLFRGVTLVRVTTIFTDHTSIIWECPAVGAGVAKLAYWKRVLAGVPSEDHL